MILKRKNDIFLFKDSIVYTYLINKEKNVINYYY